MRIEFTDAMLKRLLLVQEAAMSGDELARKQLIKCVALLDAVRDLQEKPTQESATFCRVRQARRHELWRVAHPFDAEVAARIIVWFPPSGEVVVSVFNFDKAKVGDIWYDRAAIEGEAAVDQWLREHEDEDE